MLKFGEIRDFTVVSFTAAALRGGVFGIRSGRWHLLAAAEKQLTGTKEDATKWRELWRELRGGNELTLLTGTIPGGVFFGLDTIALPPREQREALLMELPRQMPRHPVDPVLQFMPAGKSGDNGTVLLNVYAASRKQLDAATAALRKWRLRADELIHPLLTVSSADPAVFLPETDPGFYFENRKFHRAEAAEQLRAASLKQWEEIMNGLFVRDAEISDFAGFLPVFLVARFTASEKPRHHRRELQFLPSELHPVRFRRQLRLTAVLAAALLLAMLWSCGRERWKDFSAYRAVVSETRELQRKNDSMQSTLKRSAKEQKDIAKVLNSNFGESDVIGQLAAFSKLLPNDVMVTDFRWSESGIDLVLQSESENLDLPGILKPLAHWKVADIQQRQGRMSATTTVTAKLVPAEQAASRTRSARNPKNAKRTRRQ